MFRIGHCPTTLTALVVLAVLCLLLDPTTTVEGARRTTTHFVSARSVPPPRNRNYHRLHDVLAINDDPNEDIRTNILLNMEGI